jgi:hypothetical protein
MRRRHTIKKLKRKNTKKYYKKISYKRKSYKRKLSKTRKFYKRKNLIGGEGGNDKMNTSQTPPDSPSSVSTGSISTMSYGSSLTPNSPAVGVGSYAAGGVSMPGLFPELPDLDTAIDGMVASVGAAFSAGIQFEELQNSLLPNDPNVSAANKNAVAEREKADAVRDSVIHSLLLIPVPPAPAIGHWNDVQYAGLLDMGFSDDQIRTIGTVNYVWDFGRIQRMWHSFLISRMGSIDPDQYKNFFVNWFMNTIQFHLEVLEARGSAPTTIASRVTPKHPWGGYDSDLYTPTDLDSYGSTYATGSHNDSGSGSGSDLSQGSNHP